MSEDWEASDYVARAMSTRPAQIEGTDYITVVTREALEGMAAQVAEGFVPILIEHLSYIPPIGVGTPLRSSRHPTASSSLSCAAVHFVNSCPWVTTRATSFR